MHTAGKNPVLDFELSVSLRHCYLPSTTAEQTADHLSVSGSNGGAKEDQEKVCEFHVHIMLIMQIFLLCLLYNKHLFVCKLKKA